MKDRAGVLVPLKVRGGLRGCSGTFEPCERDIADEVIRNAISSATCDPRFSPVRPEELENLEYSIDVLTAPEQVNSLADLDPKRYGVIVKVGGRRALLLPDLEGVDTVEEQVGIAMQKAGILARDAGHPVPVRSEAVSLKEITSFATETLRHRE